MTKLKTLFGSSAYDTATEKNYAGAPAFYRGDEEGLLRVLTTGTFEPTFYASDRELATEAVDLFKKFADEDPKFLAQAIVYARTEGLMRTVPLTALVVLSASTNPEAKRYFRLIFSRVVQTPGDLQDVMQLCRGSKLRGMGKTVQHAIQSWLASLSEYHAIKYGAESQGMSLRDIYRLARPKLGGAANEIARYLVRGELDEATTIRQVAGYEQFKKAAREGNTTQALALVSEHRLPWEVVTSQVGTSYEAWKTMLYQLPYMALLRNLNNLLKSGVLNDQEALTYVVNTLTDPVRVAKSKQFPFRFYSARVALGGVVPAANQWGYRDVSYYTKEVDTTTAVVLKALEEAQELSFSNMPYLGNNVFIANDISGSMSSKPSTKSDMSMAQIAGLYAAAIYKRSENAEIVSFDDRVHPRMLNRDMTLSRIVDQIAETKGGTSLSAPMQYAFQREINIDTAIFITDSMSWVDHLKGRGVLDEIRAYKKRVNPELQCFFMQIEPYRGAVIPTDEPGCYYLYGWSNSTVNYIGQMATGASQLAQVRAITID